ncbi:fused MFS/spermidine synthase [Occallatibacter savannae]|uniref:fused MFS/spermidine synthase n=1 Tax=Occallatibacter savannae TaxID=1002691 RepID=UPI000D693875|nr:fused MFS/spermidine synthase [Occallatibacter savannae]
MSEEKFGRAPTISYRLLPPLFGVTVFLSAALLFLVEPMIAKMMLPLLGGSAAVWNTCMVFFQAALLAGYAFAYAGSRWLPWRVLLVVQCCVAALPVVTGVLPLTLPHGWTPPLQTTPIPWILAMLAVAVGLPFFVLSSSGPMLQRWFAASGHRGAADPYFLYAASNAGSLAGLFAYPLLLEPLLRISNQSRLWSFVYLVFAALTTLCAVLCWNRPQRQGTSDSYSGSARTSITWARRLRWIALAFIPSSLMLGVTTAMTADVPAIPLFWIVPLALYLLSFVLVFARRQIIAPETFNRRLPILILCGLLPGMLQTKLPLPALLGLYSILLFGIAMVCHGELAATRPSVHGLTEFYLLLSVGGVLGGIFNSIIAPLAFHSVLEFPIALIFAALLRRTAEPEEHKKPGRLPDGVKDWLLPLVLGAASATGFLALRFVNEKLALLMSIFVFSFAAASCLSFGKRPVRFGLGLAALFAASFLYVGPFGQILHTERSFFGVYRVSNERTDRFRYFLHGGTVHGVQSLNPARRRTPLAYYTAGGPAGQMLEAMQSRTPNASIAVVGLGAGAMACLTDPGSTITYYEIDPLVVRIAKDPHYFTFLQDCAPRAGYKIGDARLRLQEAQDSSYNMIVLDAFSGDSIPMHLLTREAMALYLNKLAPGGVLAFHVTNLYLDLSPVLGNLASEAHLASWSEDDSSISPQESSEGKFASHWIVMARSENDLASLVHEQHSTAPWVPTPRSPHSRVWTDDYSNLLSVIRWR